MFVFYIRRWHPSNVKNKHRPKLLHVKRFNPACRTNLSWQVGFAKAEAALKQSVVDMRMHESAEMAPLVRMRMLKKGDVKLLHSKFRELDQNGDSKIQWAEFERGRNTLPNSIQVAPVHVARLAHWLHKLA
jgi:hypothetical protein